MKNPILQQTADELGLSYELVDKVYKSYWDFVKATWAEIPIRPNMTEDEFRSLRTTFSHPGIGKTGCTWEKYRNMEKAREIVKSKKNGNKKNYPDGE